MSCGLLLKSSIDLPSLVLSTVTVFGQNGSLPPPAVCLLTLFSLEGQNLGDFLCRHCQLLGESQRAVTSLVFRKWPGCARDSTAILSPMNREGNQEGMSEHSVEWMVGFFQLLLLLIKLVGTIANYK